MPQDDTPSEPSSKRPPDEAETSQEWTEVEEISEEYGACVLLTYTDMQAHRWIVRAALQNDGLEQIFGNEDGEDDETDGSSWSVVQ